MESNRYTPDGGEGASPLDPHQTVQILSRTQQEPSGPPWRAQQSQGGLIRTVRRSGQGAAVQLPPEVAAHLGVGAGQHLYFALGDGGLVILARVGALSNAAAATIALSERLAARESVILRLRRKLRGAREAAFARGVNHGYMLGLRDGLREEPLSTRSSPS